MAISIMTACDLQFFYDPYAVLNNSADWKQLRSQHFVYHYIEDESDIDYSRRIKRFDGTDYQCSPGDIEGAIGEYLAHFEQWYQRLALLFGGDLSEHLPIHVYNYPSRQSQYELIGTYAAQSIEYAPMGSNEYRIHLGSEGVCAHELIHLFQLLLGNAPPLLSEGMAVALAGADWDGALYSDLPTLHIGNEAAYQQPRWQGKPLHQQAAQALAIKDFSIPIAYDPIPALRPSDLIYWGSNLSRQWYLYCISGSFVHYLVETHGWTPFLEWYSTIDSSTLSTKDFHTAFYQSYGCSFLQAEEGYIAMLEAL
ncbi:MAG: hypothetical protein RBT04_02460 [Sphaerochaetaceae bacterium]|nr:hypothetical protein [Sphaerochaetaceae bacterium]